MFTIVRKQFQQLIREKSLYFWLILLPILFMVIFGTIFSEENMMYQIVPGYTVMFVFFIIISMVRGFFQDKESGMLARLSSTPVKPLEYLMGMYLSYVVITLIQSVALLTFGHVVYGLNLGNPFEILLLLIALSLCSTGIGLVVSLYVTSENMGIGLTQLFSMGGAMVGGLWMPTEMLPAFIQKIGYVTPQYWAQKGFYHIMSQSHWVHLLPTLGILLAVAVVGMLISLGRFRGFLAKAVH